MPTSRFLTTLLIFSLTVTFSLLRADSAATTPASVKIGSHQPQATTAHGCNKPVVGDPSQLTADNAAYLAIKKQLLGYYAADGIIYMMNGASTTNAWDVRHGIFYITYSVGHPESEEGNDIVTLTQDKFVFRSRVAKPITFTETRTTQQEAEDGVN
jgi:hypothetical protein